MMTGCSLIAPTTSQVPKGERAGGVRDDGYHDVTGVIHIHTIYSDGAGTFDEIARVANRLHLDYLIVTDHNTLRPLRDGQQGWRGATLILVGTELSTRAGHLLALNVQREIRRDQPVQAIIDEIARQGGLSFIAHPYFSRRRWTDWTVTGVTGIEGYNAVHDTFDENRVRLALWGLAAPPDEFYLSLLDRPYDPLSAWDRLCQRLGRAVGIGSADAHELSFMGLKVAPYAVLFKLVRTHALLPQGSTLTPDALYGALRQGHAFFSLDLVTDATGFTFMADDGREVRGVMGDEVPLSADLRLTALLPAPGTMALIKDGQRVQETAGRVWHVPIDSPGVYRLEVTRQGKPWIFSNPIYVRNADAATR